MLGEGRACRSPALATGNGRSWVSGGAPGHVGEAAQRVQPGARACRTPSRSPPGPRAARSALPPRVSMFQEAAHSGGRILKSPPVSAGRGGWAVCNRSHGTPCPGPRRRASKAGAFPDPPCPRVCLADARGCGAASPEASPVVPEADS